MKELSNPDRFQIEAAEGWLMLGNPVEANEELGFAVDARDYKQCAEILFDLGLCKVRVISNNPDKLEALKAAGLNNVERIPLEIPAEQPAAHYLRTKKEKLGHLLS